MIHFLGQSGNSFPKQKKPREREGGETLYLIGIIQTCQHIDHVISENRGNDGLAAWLGNP
jgi:hypothetical protein